EIGAAGWLFVDEIRREIDGYFGRTSGTRSTRADRIVAGFVAVASVFGVAIALALVWAALVP
ncbi:MAG TPA: hypothetical protein VJQ09_05695, partial [Candidatus Limnocylindria bacterium]|nr:hypothetical protein [Candidatus Limnocylindria bacterium]